MGEVQIMSSPSVTYFHVVYIYNIHIVLNEIDFNEKSILKVLAVTAAQLKLLVLAWQTQEKSI